MDSIDRQIIGKLQQDGRISVADLAESVNLGSSATSERLRRLRSSGVIRRFSIELDAAAIGRTIEAIVDVRFSSSYDPDVDFDLPAFAPVIDAMHLTGPFDLQLRVMCTSVTELDDLLVALKDAHGAVETNTRLVLRTLDGFPRHPLLISS